MHSQAFCQNFLLHTGRVSCPFIPTWGIITLPAVLAASPWIAIHQPDWSSPPFLVLTPWHVLPHFLAALQDTVFTKHQLLGIFPFRLENRKPASLLWHHETWNRQTSQSSQGFFHLVGSGVLRDHFKVTVLGFLSFVCEGGAFGGITQSSFQTLYRGWCCCQLTASPWAPLQWPPSPC